MQATLAPAGFALFFEPKWAGCVPIIIALSIGQAFLFAVMPASALMKAQGRFTVFCIWQFTQLVGSISAYALAVNYGQGIAANMIEYSGLTLDEQSVTPFAIAVASAVAWALFLPRAVDRVHSTRSGSALRVASHEHVLLRNSYACADTCVLRSDRIAVSDHRLRA